MHILIIILQINALLSLSMNFEVLGKFRIHQKSFMTSTTGGSTTTFWHCVVTLGSNIRINKFGYTKMQEQGALTLIKRRRQPLDAILYMHFA